MITIAQIRAAQNNDLAGITAVLTEMDERISRLAAQAARRIDGNLREDFEQDAREALFLALPRVEGGSVDRAVGFLYSSMADALKDRVREQRYTGVDKDAVKTFMSVLGDAQGDPYKAAQLAQELPKGSRLSADRADAARLAWQGAASIDKGSDDETGSIADTLAVTDEVPQVQPKVGHGAALEALAVLNRYVCVGIARQTPGEFAANLPALVETLEDTVCVPSDPTIRRYVLDAMAILRSAVSTADDGDLVEELRDVADERRDERAAKHGAVTSVLDDMATAQADALRYSYGIAGYATYGTGDSGDLDGLAEALGVTKIQARDARTKGHKSFARRYIKAVAADADQAQAMTDAAARNLGRGGRK